MTEMSHKQNKFKIWNYVIYVSIAMDLLVLLLIVVISGKLGKGSYSS